MTREKDDQENPRAPRPQSKKPYSVPKLTVHGTVKDITLNSINGFADGVLVGSHL